MEDPRSVIGYIANYATAKSNTTHCKGICHRFKTPRPVGVKGKDPFETHRYCRKCTEWFDKKNVYKLAYCPCCHMRVATKSRKSKAIGTKKKRYI